MGDFGCGDGGWTLIMKINGSEVKIHLRANSLMREKRQGGWQNLRLFPWRNVFYSLRPLRVVKSCLFALAEWELGTSYYWDLIENENTNFILCYEFQRTFHYDSQFWSNRSAYNLRGGKTGFDLQETKLPTFWTTSFSKICLGMKIGNQLRFIVINKRADSLHSLIADGKYRNTSLGRETWKWLIGSQASLQPKCSKEGFNAVGDRPSFSKARIGITANQQNDCFSCNSRIGFGTGGRHDDSNTCGNEATRSPDNGNKHIKAMGYILVQW